MQINLDLKEDEEDKDHLVDDCDDLGNTEEDELLAKTIAGEEDALLAKTIMGEEDELLVKTIADEEDELVKTIADEEDELVKTIADEEDELVKTIADEENIDASFLSPKIRSDGVIGNINRNNYIQNFKQQLQLQETICCCSLWTAAHVFLILGLMWAIADGVYCVVAFINFNDTTTQSGQIFVMIGASSDVIGVLINLVGLYGIYHCKPNYILLYFIEGVAGLVLLTVAGLGNPGLIYIIILWILLKVWILSIFWKIYSIANKNYDHASVGMNIIANDHDEQTCLND